MPTEKIGDIIMPCMDRDHDPPTHMLWPPGVYKHTCPSCGAICTFTVYPTVCAT